MRVICEPCWRCWNRSHDRAAQFACAGWCAWDADLACCRDNGHAVRVRSTYGPRADRLQSSGDLAQMLLNFAEEMDRKPVNPDDLPPRTDPEEELRRVKRRKGRSNLANFDNLPVTTQVHELNAAERACPCCGAERKEIGADESWQMEYLPGHFE